MWRSEIAPSRSAFTHSKTLPPAQMKPDRELPMWPTISYAVRGFTSPLVLARVALDIREYEE
jgi:hypothetical protein